MNLAFYLRGVPCRGESLETQPLGGTESALLYMARALAARGHNVFVFMETSAHQHAGVNYQAWQDFERIAPQLQLDVFVCIRSLLPLLVRRWARYQVYFSPDAADQPFVRDSYRIQVEVQGKAYELGFVPLRQVAQYVDKIFCVGHWQAESFVQQLKVPREKIWVTANGVGEEFFAAEPSPRPPQLIYCSTPFRGLDYLLDYFPEIRARVPDARCVVVSGMQLYGFSAAADQEQFAELYAKAQQPGVTLHAPVTKPQLARLLQTSSILAYPNTFAETFCIAALEAQAAGLPVVTSALAGLRERVHEGVHGYLIPGHPRETSYRDAFIEACVHLLRDKTNWQRQSRAAQARAGEFTYARLAERWEEFLQEELRQQRPTWQPYRPHSERLRWGAPGQEQSLDLSAEQLGYYYWQALRAEGFGQSEPVRAIIDDLSSRGISN